MLAFFTVHEFTTCQVPAWYMQFEIWAMILFRLINTSDVFYRFDPERKFGANAGLEVARDLLEPIKKKFDWITYDLHAQFACVPWLSRYQPHCWIGLMHLTINGFCLASGS